MTDVKKRQPPSIRSRDVWMTEADWRAFGNMLVTVYPRGRYFFSPDTRFAQEPSPPTVILHEHLLDAAGWGDASKMVWMLFRPAWKPRFHKSWHDKKDDPEDWHWSLTAPANPKVLFRLGPQYTAERLQQIDVFRHGEIHFYCDPDNGEQVALRRQFFRLAAKFACNRRISIFRRLDNTLIRVEEKGSRYWLGHDAIRWAKKKREGMFIHLNSDWGARPTDAIHPARTGKPSRRRRAISKA